MYLIIFQLGGDSSTLKLKINRKLKKTGARRIQKSVWTHENAQKLIEVASLIKARGGKAMVLEANVIYE
jgi:CRISPR/Cas system-associated endoribonuclease Cas2